MTKSIKLEQRTVEMTVIAFGEIINCLMTDSLTNYISNEFFISLADDLHAGVKLELLDFVGITVIRMFRGAGRR